MKKLITVLIFILITILAYAFNKKIEMKTDEIKFITYYAGSTIVKYDLGDVECFSTRTYGSLSCLRK